MPELIYLDNAATTFPKPDVVHDSVRDFYRNYGVNPGRTSRGRRGQGKRYSQTRNVLSRRLAKKGLKRVRAGN